jgi:hypothetical protein
MTPLLSLADPLLSLADDDRHHGIYAAASNCSNCRRAPFRLVVKLM